MRSNQQDATIKYNTTDIYPDDHFSHVFLHFTVHLCRAVFSVLHYCTHHVAQPHSRVVGVVLHQGVVMCREERATADLLSKLLHNSTGNRCAIICGCAPSYKQGTAECYSPKHIPQQQQQQHTAEETACDVHGYCQ